MRRRSLLSWSILLLMAPLACEGGEGETNAGPGPGEGEGASQGEGEVEGSEGEGAAEAEGTGEPAPRDDLLFLIEEEKVARDVYRTLGERWGLSVFGNIGASEQRHIDAVAGLLDAAGVASPIRGAAVGSFADPHLQELFDQLVEVGLRSEVAALEVGATIEDLDLRDIQQMTTRTSDPAVLATYSSLSCGSRNHLRAFVGQLRRTGGDYSNQFLSAREIEEILAGSREACGL
jgi:hypothetical protein